MAMDSLLRLTFRPYQRHFQRPLKTHHGLWSLREGILLQLEDGLGHQGQGEIAPLPWFGSETLEEALYFCRHLPDRFSVDEVRTIPDHLPACQFGFSAALQGLYDSRNRQLHQSPCPEEEPPLTYSALLPTGEAALTHWMPLWQQGYRTFKWKIGVRDSSSEQDLYRTLRNELPPTARIRLDANGGLDLQTAHQWLALCDQPQPGTESSIIEYLEQPMQQLDDMIGLREQYRTPIALDESVATLNQLRDCYQRGWRGIFVIKPAIAGDPAQLRQFCLTHALDVVCSSVFETEVGRRVCLQLARELSTRAVGFGIDHWFMG
jgi:o-succinylbenzoate synthase